MDLPKCTAVSVYVIASFIFLPVGLKRLTIILRANFLEKLLAGSV